jgi:hypothetical protein
MKYGKARQMQPMPPQTCKMVNKGSTKPYDLPILL